MKIKFNTETKQYDLYKGAKVIDTGTSQGELARKYKMFCVFYDGTFMHLSTRR